MRRTSLTCSLALLLVAAAPAHAADAPADRRIAVRVTEVAGGRAFLSPGGDAGLEPGAAVVLKNRRFLVVEVTAASAVIVIADAPVEEGDKGVALASAKAASRDERMPAPPALEHFAGKWPVPAHPAEAQRPRPVPLGRAGESGPLDLTLSAHAYTVKARHQAPVGELALGAELSVEPWRERPFGVDADATAYTWWGPAGGPAGVTESSLRVRELRLRYGGEADPYAAIGRLRWAARGVGLLDGVRVRVPVAPGLGLAAFGGFVPDPVSDAPATDASRFGVAASWDRPGSAARPHLDATVSGSVFGGALDERRVDVGGALSPGPLQLAGRAEVSLFASDNPWGAHAVELSAAGVDATFRAGSVHAGLHVDARQPERSRYLQSLLPAGWLCDTVPGPPGTVEPCDGRRNLRLSGAADAGYARGKLALSAGAQAIAADGAEDAVVGGFADLRLLDLGDGWRVGVGGTVLAGPVDLSALRLELGGSFLGGRLDTTAFYRVSTVSYVAALETFVQHRAGFGVAWTVTPELDLAFQLEGESGPDLKAVTGIATAVWRPFP